METLALTLLGYLCGSLPFSVWLGRLFLGADVRQFGADGNPGAANAWRAGKGKLGIPVLLLDFLKAALPIGYAHFILNISGWPLLPIALAPAIGHAYSIFLGFRGGKALVVTFAIWTVVAFYQGPFILGALFVLFYLTVAGDAWAVMFAMTCFLVYLLLAHSALPVLAIWAGNTALLAWRHRQDLRQPLRLRPSLAGSAH
jgi:acyl phosphate:glycerol-3-phosphate acyltransferase